MTRLRKFVEKPHIYQQTPRVINKNADFPLFYLLQRQIRINLFQH